VPPGQYTVSGHVDDGRGGTADCSVNVEAQAPPVSPEVKQLEQRLALRSIYFQTDRPKDATDGIVESQEEVLTSLADDFKRYLTFKPDAHLTLEGHCDKRGSIEYNQALGERRVTQTKSYLVEHGVPAGSIQTESFGKQQELDADQVKQLIEQNPELSAEEREKILSNLPVLVLANNRRVDVTLSTTGEQSVREYPFNARDYLSLVSPRNGGKGSMPRARRKIKTQ
jgi:outer membrane protein OmpA-like peptidoglycan-associated protein